MTALTGVKVIDMIGGEVSKISYNGEEYAKVALQDGEIYPKVGDVALRTEPTGVDITAGNYYAVDSVGYSNNPHVSDDVGDKYLRPRYTFDFFRKATSAPVTKPASEVKVGDKIRIVKASLAFGSYENGDEFTVARVTETGNVYVEEHGIVICAIEFEVIGSPDDQSQPSEADERITDLEQRVTALEATQPSVQQAPPLKVGDYAKVIREVDEYKAGDIIEVTGGESPSGHYDLTVEKVFANNHRGYIDREYVVPATAEEVAEAKAKLAVASFEVDDKVRLVSGGGTYPLNGFVNGEVYKITGTDADHRRSKIRISRLDGRRSGYPRPDQLEKLSAEEAQQIEADRAVAAKFAEIGRAVGEFKAGDIVKVTDTLCTTFLTVGQVTEIIDFGYEEIPKVRSNDGGTRNAKVELITPVERRFDR